MDIVSYIINKIVDIKGTTPLLVAIDGVDTAGKTILADKIRDRMLAKKLFSPLRISIDRFHNPREIRTKRGKLSPEGYFLDSFNYPEIINCIIRPVKERQPYLINGIFDFRTDKQLQPEKIPLSDQTVVLFDGIFLLRDELYKFWNISVFLDISFETILKRALDRDLDLFGTEKEILRKYKQRYIPGQKIYLERCNPRQRADLVFDNNDPENP